MNILGNTSEIHGVFPRVTWWQTHERACEIFHLYFENFLDAFSTPYAKQKEAEALELFIQGSSYQTIATNLMLFDVFKSTKMFSNNYIFYQTHSVYPPTPVSAGRGWTSCQIFKKDRGARQDLNFERGVAGKEGDNFFQEGLQFLQKNKLKSEIFRACVRYFLSKFYFFTKW